MEPNDVPSKSPKHSTQNFFYPNMMGQPSTLQSTSLPHNPVAEQPSTLQSPPHNPVVLLSPEQLLAFKITNLHIMKDRLSAHPDLFGNHLVCLQRDFIRYYPYIMRFHKNPPAYRNFDYLNGLSTPSYYALTRLKNNPCELALEEIKNTQVMVLKILQGDGIKYIDPATRNLISIPEYVDASGETIFVQKLPITANEEQKSAVSKGIKKSEEVAKLQKEMDDSAKGTEKIFAEDGPNAIPGAGDEIAEQAGAQAELAKVKKLEKIKQAEEELKRDTAMAGVISFSTELIISLVDESRLCRTEKQTVQQAVWNICKRTAKATAHGAVIAARNHGVQYGFIRMALAESKNLASIGKFCSKIFCSAVAADAHQLYGIWKQYRKDKELSPEFALKRAFINLLRMVLLKVVPAISSCIASGPVVGAVVTIGLTVADHFFGEWLG